MARSRRCGGGGRSVASAPFVVLGHYGRKMLFLRGRGEKDLLNWSNSVSRRKREREMDSENKEEKDEQVSQAVVDCKEEEEGTDGPRIK